MKKISDYRQHAEECRLLARRADSAEHRDMLLNMASTWDALADGRKRTLAQQGNLESDEGGQASPGGEQLRCEGVAAATAAARSQTRANDEKAD